MKKIWGILVLGFVFCNIAQAESLLSNCVGTDSFKWTNCFGSEKKNIAYDLLYKDAYKDKKILYEGEYKNGKREGVWDWYFVDYETSLDTTKFGESLFEEGTLTGEMNEVVEDNVLIKKATYNIKTKETKVIEVVPYAMPENELKIKFFKKWKAEAEAKDQTMRNERYAHRLAVNGH